MTHSHKALIHAGDYKKCCIIVQYGIDNCSPRNQPYSFSITGTIYSNQTYNTADRYFVAGGCIHEEIERRFKGKFTDLIAFHLRHEDGSPMSPQANCFFQAQCYWGERDWNGFSKERCLEWFAGDMMLDEEEAHELLELMWVAKCAGGDEPAKQYLAKAIEIQAPKWKAEARRLKTKYNLPDYEIFD